jgi:hypothetical protein
LADDVPYFWRNLIQPSNRHYNPSNRHVIQQALQLRKPSSQFSTCERAYSLRAVWPAEEVGATSFPGLFPFCHWEGGKRPWHRAVFYVFWLVNDKYIIMQIMQSWFNLFKLWDKLTFSRKECPYLFIYSVRLRNIFGKMVKFDKIYTQFVEG